ncbi:hypothetical protein [Nioella sp.]|uniref:hypothetical protein n=1 Tax=Nioella sp. TaxID=1912091 RepID=UPI003A8C5692
MKEAFREAFIEHVAVYRVKIAAMSRDTGVSKTLLQSLHQRKTVCPNVDDAIKIAGHFGKSVEQFLDLKPDDDLTQLQARYAQLDLDDQSLVRDFVQMLQTRAKSGAR